MVSSRATFFIVTLFLAMAMIISSRPSSHRGDQNSDDTTTPFDDKPQREPSRNTGRKEPSDDTKTTTPLDDSARSTSTPFPSDDLKNTTVPSVSTDDLLQSDNLGKYNGNIPTFTGNDLFENGERHFDVPTTQDTQSYQVKL